jgi:hypothetical protein
MRLCEFSVLSTVIVATMAAVVVVGVVTHRIVDPVGGRRPAAAMKVMGLLPRRIIVAAPHHVDLGRVIRSVVRPMA